MQLINSQGVDHECNETRIGHDLLCDGWNRSEEIMVSGKPDHAAQKMSCDCSEKAELQVILNALRNWVLDRNGDQFTINDLYADPAISYHLSASIQTMVLIDRALMTLRCTIEPKNRKAVSLQALVYTPPKVRRVDFIST